MYGGSYGAREFGRQGSGSNSSACVFGAPRSSNRTNRSRFRHRLAPHRFRWNRKRQRPTTSWKVCWNHNSDTWFPSICWNEPGSHYLSCIAYNETRKSACIKSIGFALQLKKNPWVLWVFRALQRARCYLAAQARPSAPAPASISCSTFHSLRFSTATCPLASQDT
jgi:hypothetical protein